MRANAIEKLEDHDQLRSILSIGDTKILQNMSDVLSILSKMDALQIFVLAKNGLKSELDTPQKIGLTKKQYYTRLKQLYDLNLVTKKSDVYIHTTLGDLVYNKHVQGFLQIMSNIKEFEMLDVLKTSSRFNSEEISQFISRLNIEYSDSTASIKKAAVADSFDTMVSKVLEIIEFAQHEILIASRFTNDLIINSVLKKSTAGVKVRILADINTVQGFFDTSGKAINKQDKNEPERTEVVANPFYPSKIERRYVHTPFSLIVVDDKSIGMEIVDNYNPEKFLMSVHMTDENLAKQIKVWFDKWWKDSSAYPPKPLAKISKRN